MLSFMFDLFVNKVEIIGFIAAVVTTLSMIPQVYKVIKTKVTAGISLGYFVLLQVGMFLWLTYGLLIMNYPLIVANALSIIFITCIVFIKSRNVLSGKDSETFI